VSTVPQVKCAESGNEENMKDDALTDEEFDELERRLRDVFRQVGQEPLLNVFVAEVAKRAVEMTIAELGEQLGEFRKQIGERDELCKQLLGRAELCEQLLDELQQARWGRLIDPNEFCSAVHVIRNLPAPKVRMFRGLSQFVSNILTEACERKGVRWEQFSDGSKLFPVGRIDEDLEDKIRQYAAGLKLRQILPFPVRK
jgi:hypothetical protein